MKKWMIVLALTMSSSAFAGLQSQADADAGPAYLSWCTKEDQIASHDDKGVININADCAKDGKKCQELRVTKLNHIYAVCK
ncbi:MAG: hypothetical protein EOP09_11255 [Proteobacteria bacterium]|nr:MAG: hypothetical protein EOP09_11255 [Pseudomonadota bacterium]